METENRKIFVGGLSKETCNETLANYFENYGEIIKCEVIKNRTTGNSRCFGFVTFADPSAVDRACSIDRHVILRHEVEVKKAEPRGEKNKEQHPQILITNNGQQQNNNNRVNNGNTQFNNKKIFVGGLPSNLTLEEFRGFFESFGPVTDVVIMYDQERRPRGFGFITFESEDVVNSVLETRYHTLKYKQVEVKRAEPPTRMINHATHIFLYDCNNNGFEPGQSMASNVGPNWNNYAPGIYSGANYNGIGCDYNNIWNFYSIPQYQYYQTRFAYPSTHTHYTSSAVYANELYGGNGNGNGRNRGIRITAPGESTTNQASNNIAGNVQNSVSNSGNVEAVAVESGITTIDNGENDSVEDRPTTELPGTDEASRLEDNGADNQKELNGQSSPGNGQSSP